MKEKIIYKKFNEFIKETKTAVCDTSALSSLIMKHRIVICLLRKYITKNKK